MKKVKYYLLSGKTRVNVDKLSTPLLFDLLPSEKDTLNHIKLQLGSTEFQPIVIETDKLEQLNIEIRKKSCNYVGYSKIVIYIESYSSKQVLPLFLIIEKK